LKWDNLAEVIRSAFALLLSSCQIISFISDVCVSNFSSVFVTFVSNGPVVAAVSVPRLLPVPFLDMLFPDQLKIITSKHICQQQSDFQSSRSFCDPMHQ
jgi:hypothetical protein